MKAYRTTTNRPFCRWGARQIEAESGNHEVLSCVCFSLCRAAWPTGLLAAKGQEADSNGDKARKMQRELDATRRDAEGMLQVGARPSPVVCVCRRTFVFVRCFL